MTRDTYAELAGLVEHLVSAAGARGANKAHVEESIRAGYGDLAALFVRWTVRDAREVELVKRELLRKIEREVENGSRDTAARAALAAALEEAP